MKRTDRSNAQRSTPLPGGSRKATMLIAAAASTAVLLASGCGVGVNGDAAGSQASALVSGLRGNVIGGQQPVSGATIQLYAVGSTGNASTATALLPAGTLSDANGNFSINGLYSCPANSMVYIAANGGNPGLQSGTSNSAISLMAGLGDCATLKANAATTFITINEVTTVATVYALGAFITDYTNVGYAAGNATGMANAFATERVLTSLATGTASTSAVSGVTLPRAVINSLADSIAPCVNSAGPTSTACTALFSATGVGNGHLNTVAAVAALAHSPGTNVAAIYNLATPTAPFAPQLSQAPADWTLSIYYNGGGLSTPQGVALDAAGNAWVANEGGNGVTEITRAAYGSGTGGFTSPTIVSPQAVAVDTSGNIWLANTGANSVVKLNSATGAVTQTLTTGLSAPNALAFDGSGRLWVTNFSGNSVAAFTSAGTALAGSPFTTNTLSAPTGVAVDASNNVWVSSSLNGTVAKVTSAGAVSASYTDGLLVAPGGVATDSAHSRVWTAGTGINAVVGFTSAGSPVFGEPFATGVTLPASVAVDGNGTVWTVNDIAAGSLSGFTFSGAAVTPATGLGLLNQPAGIAVDASGNIWATSMGDSSVTQFLGLAAPVLTPLVAGTR